MQILQTRDGMCSPERILGTIYDFEEGHVVASHFLDGQPEEIVGQAASRILTRALERGESTRLLTMNERQFEQITGLVVRRSRHRN